MPALAEDTETTLGLLGALTRVWGAPLVLKLDNGGAFRSYEVKTWAAAKGVLPLYSPPYVPQYNGSIEAGGGSLKVRAHHQSVRHGRSGEWTCDDVEAARCQGNETGRPWGRRGPTPEEVWHGQVKISDNERAAFLDTYLAHARAERRERRMGEHEVLSHEEQSAVDRMAISRALIDHGLLKVRTRRITPPVARAKTVRIT
jgi:transposase InsO family protein